MSAMFARENAMKTTVLLVAAGLVAGAVACTTPKTPEIRGATVSGELTAPGILSDESSKKGMRVSGTSRRAPWPWVGSVRS